MTISRYHTAVLICFLLNSAHLLAGPGGSKFLTDPDGLASRIAAAVQRPPLNLEEGLVASDSHFSGQPAVQQDDDELEDEGEDPETERAHDEWLTGEIPLSPTSSQPTQESRGVLNPGGQEHLNFIAQIQDQADLQLQKIRLRCQAILTNGTQQEKDLLKNELLKELSRLLCAAERPGVILKDGTELPPVMAVNEYLIDFAYLLLELGIHEGLQVFDHTYMNIERLRKLMSFQGDIHQGYFQRKVADYFAKFPTERLAVLNLLYENEHYKDLRGQLYACWKAKAPFELDPRKPGSWRLKFVLGEQSNSILMGLIADEIREFARNNPGQVAAIYRFLAPFPHHHGLGEELLAVRFSGNPYWR